jgi:hypothetical protein
MRFGERVSAAKVQLIKQRQLDRFTQNHFSTQAMIHSPYSFWALVPPLFLLVGCFASDPPQPRTPVAACHALPQLKDQAGCLIREAIAVQARLCPPKPELCALKDEASGLWTASNLLRDADFCASRAHDLQGEQEVRYQRLLVARRMCAIGKALCQQNPEIGRGAMSACPGLDRGECREAIELEVAIVDAWHKAKEFGRAREEAGKLLEASAAAGRCLEVMQIRNRSEVAESAGPDNPVAMQAFLSCQTQLCHATLRNIEALSAVVPDKPISTPEWHQRTRVASEAEDRCSQVGVDVPLKWLVAIPHLSDEQLKEVERLATSFRPMTAGSREALLALAQLQEKAHHCPEAYRFYDLVGEKGKAVPCVIEHARSLYFDDDPAKAQRLLEQHGLPYDEVEMFKYFVTQEAAQVAEYNVFYHGSMARLGILAKREKVCGEVAHKACQQLDGAGMKRLESHLLEAIRGLRRKIKESFKKKNLAGGDLLLIELQRGTISNLESMVAIFMMCRR